MQGSTDTGAAEPVHGGEFGGAQVPGDHRPGQRPGDEVDREPDPAEPHQGGGVAEVDPEPLVDVHDDLTVERVGQSAGGPVEMLRASSLGGYLPMAVAAHGRAVRAFLLQHSWVVLMLWSLGWALLHVADHGWSWHFLVTGSEALFSSSGLDLYVQHPELQMGPVTFIVGAPFALLPQAGVGEAAAMMFMLIIGLLVVRELKEIVGGDTEVSGQLWFRSSLVVMLVWTELAVHWVHLDDGLALLCTMVGLRLVRSGRVLMSAVVLGLAVDFKPWAVPFVAIVLIAPRRQWVPAVLVWVAVVAVAWAPFVIAFPDTVHLAGFTIPVDPASTLHVFGALDGTPEWCRYAQMLGGTAVAVLAVARGRWASVLLVVIALRMLLDPATKTYYEAGLMVGTAVFDLALAVSAYPVVTLLAFVAVYLPDYAFAHAPMVRGLERTAALLALIAVGLLLPRHSTRNLQHAVPSDAPEPSL